MADVWQFYLLLVYSMHSYKACFRCTLKSRLKLGFAHQRLRRRPSLALLVRPLRWAYAWAFASSRNRRVRFRVLASPLGMDVHGALMLTSTK